MANGTAPTPQATPGTTTLPAQQQNISELAPLQKSIYPRTKIDRLGLKFAKGHRTADLLQGPRPLMRRPRRAR